jgi:hypothetical protein
VGQAGRVASAVRESRSWAGAATLALALSVLAWWPMLASYPLTQSADGQYWQAFVEAVRASLLHHHELPLWNPYECGGVPLWAHPEGIAAAPLLWLALPLGTTRALHAWYVVHSALGFLCMWLLARRALGLGPAASLLAGTLWAFCGFYQQHLSVGHANFVGFLYFPLALLCWRQAETDVRWSVALGGLLAWMMLEGAAEPLPQLAVVLGLETLTRLRPRRLSAIVRAGGVALAVALSVGAVRFLPVIEQLRSHTRRIEVERDALRPETVAELFLARGADVTIEGQAWQRQDYLAYLGPVVLGLAAIGLFLLQSGEAWLPVLLVGAGALMLGRWDDHSPWALLQAYVYPFRQLRVPSRFAATVSLALVALAALAVDRVSALARRRLPRERAAAVRWLAVGLALVGAADVIVVGLVRTPPFFDSPPPAPTRVSPRFFYDGPGLVGPIEQPRQNRGQLTCWALEEWGRGGSRALWSGDRPQAEGPGVEWVERSPGSFRLVVDGNPQPVTIAINSHFDAGWRTDVGALESRGGRLTLRMPPGRHEVHLRYWPRFLTAGILVTALGLTGSGLFLYRRSRTNPRAMPDEGERPSAAIASGRPSDEFLRKR